MSETIIKQYKRLILPPESATVETALQLDIRDGLAGPERIQDRAALTARLKEHLSAKKTYAFKPAWTDLLSDRETVKCGLLEINEGEPSLSTAETLVTLAKAGGLTAMPAWSGDRGCQVWIFSEPVDREVMAAVLKWLKGMAAFFGRLIPGDREWVIPPPAWNRASRSWAFFYRPGAASLRSKTRKSPDKGFLAVQAALLAETRPTAANILEDFAQTVHDLEWIDVDPRDMIPDLSKREGRAPPCIESLLKQGGTKILGTYGRHNLLLARYCRSAGLSKDKSEKLAGYLANQTSPELGNSQDTQAKLRHWQMLQEAPTLDEAPFSCLYLLPARKVLRFDCGRCKVRPPGIDIEEVSPAVEGGLPLGLGQDAETLVLEKPLADQLLALSWKQGSIDPRLEPAVFPLTLVKNEEDARLFWPLRGLIWRGLKSGVRTTVELAAWLEKGPVGEWPPEVRKSLIEGSVILARRLQTLSLPDRPVAEALQARAVNLSARIKLYRALTEVRGKLLRPEEELDDLVRTLTQQAWSCLKAQDDEYDAPLARQAEELLGDLFHPLQEAVPLFCPSLNPLLDGGLQAGRLYILQAALGQADLGAQWADQAAASGTPTLLVTYVHSRETYLKQALARYAGLDPSGMTRSKEIDPSPLFQAAGSYLQEVGGSLTLIEGDYLLNIRRLQVWAARQRAALLTDYDRPLLIIIEDPFLMNPELENREATPENRWGELAVQLKKLAREARAAVVAVIKTPADSPAPQGRKSPQEPAAPWLSLAADSIFLLRTETGFSGRWSEAKLWQDLAVTAGESEAAAAMERAGERITGEINRDAVPARLDLIKNRGSLGSQPLIYQRTCHRFFPVDFSPKDNNSEGAD